MQQSEPKKEWKCRWNKKNLGGKKWQFSSWQKNFKLKEKRSGAKPSWKYFSSSYGSSQLGSDSSLRYDIVRSKKLLSLVYNPVYDAVVILKRKKDSLLFFPQPINYINYMNQWNEWKLLTAEENNIVNHFVLLGK